METIFDTIRAAIAREASAEVRAAGIEACRAILTTLGVKPDEQAPRQPEVGPLANAVAGLIKTTPPDQLMDMLIAKLRAAVPAGAEVAPMHKINIPIIRIPTP
ncbi:MAG TPA: hypothetical protein VGM88_27895 [Kofleriaceae bacterium]|jgi:hypothetical protein